MPDPRNLERAREMVGNPRIFPRNKWPFAKGGLWTEDGHALVDHIRAALDAAEYRGERRALAQENTGSVRCHDCGEQYGSPRFPDLIIPLGIWRRISPTGDEGGLLCPGCICARLEERGIERCPAAFMSGPIRSVSYEEMDNLRRSENKELEER